jgi:hypothetical protein
MKVSAILSRAGGSTGPWLAVCEEVDRTGEGATPDEALASLREALREYFGVQAVAPPSHPVTAPIDIVVLDAPTDVPLMRWTR